MGDTGQVNDRRTASCKFVDGSSRPDIAVNLSDTRKVLLFLAREDAQLKALAHEKRHQIRADESRSSSYSDD